MTNNLFDNFVREKLSNYSSPVSDNMWNRINAKEKKRKPFFFLTTKNIVTTVATVALLVTILYSLKPSSNSITSQNNNQKLENNNVDVTISNNSTEKSIQNNNVEIIPEQKITSTAKNNTTNNINSPVLNPTSTFVQPNSNFKKEKKSSINNLEFQTNELINSELETNMNFEKMNLSTYSLKNFNKSFAKNALLSKDAFYNSIDDCPSVRGVFKNDLYFEIYGSPDYVQKMTNSGIAGSLNYLKKKDSSENTMGSYTAGVRLSKTLGEHFVLKSGIQYSQVNEKFKYSNENEIRFITVVTIRTIIRSPGDTLIIRDTSLMQQQGTRVKTTYNKYRSLDIPLIIGYEWGGEKIRVSVNAGIILNLRSWQQGETLDTSFVPATFNSNAGIKYKQNIGLSIYAGISVMKKIGKNTELFFEPFIKKNLGNMTEANSVFQQKFNTTGISIGLRYKLKGFGQQYQGK